MCVKRRQNQALMARGNRNRILLIQHLSFAKICHGDIDERLKEGAAFGQASFKGTVCI